VSRANATHTNSFQDRRRLGESLIVGRRSIDRRYRLIEQAEIHGQLSSMVSQMIHGIAEHDVPRLIHHDAASRTQPPIRRQQKVVGGCTKRRDRVRDVSILGN
jgi:hypothetical protein